ncbi:uncharacterized protein LOC121152245 [Ochotona curzoniae]|uniref:uncharacterized protein LOC121152245 n=1 Tax=Ochotona curzoniae TaxID=130825 RepID=UPI001B348DD7|nr:uncharacterized protein LOC121152245 [Ochotona curzoniae]
MLTVVVQVELGSESGPEACTPTLLLEGPRSLHLLQPGTPETQLAWQELLAQVQPLLGSVGQGYSVALLLQGQEAQAPQLVPQLLQMLFEEVQALSHSDTMLSMLSLVQLSPHGMAQDLLSLAEENLSVLNVAPLGLVVEGAKEVEVTDSRAASELYLQATGAEGRDCPLLQVLAGEVTGEEEEGSLPWTVSWLLEGNNYSGVLLHLDPQGISLTLLQAALSGALERRMQAKQVRPTLWDAVEEARARRAGLKTLRLSLLGDTLTNSGLGQLGRALRELQVCMVGHGGTRGGSHSQSRYEFSFHRTKENHSSVFSTEDNAAPTVQTGVVFSCVVIILFPLAARTASLGSRLQPKHPSGNTEEQDQQAPDVALQFSLAQAQRQRLREQHHIWIREKLKHLETLEEVAEEQNKGLVPEDQACEARTKWHRERTVLRLQLEALQEERDRAEQDLAALYDLHVQAARARTCHMLQVFRAWQELWEEQARTTEHCHRNLLADILQDTINLATQNQELQAQNWQLQHGAD